MELKDCSRCMVYTPEGKQEARVVHKRGSVALFFDDYKLREDRLQSRVDFYDERSGLIQTVCELVLCRNPGFPEIPEPWMADCRIMDVRDVVQRQRDIRARVCLGVECSSEPRGVFNITIKNLSAGGMYITTLQPLDKGEVIAFNYCFRTLERRFEAVTLWGRQGEGGRYGYGCRFIHMTNGAEAAIRSFVFKKILERQKEKE